MNIQSIRYFLFNQDSWLWRPNRPLLYWLTTAVFVSVIAVTICDVLDFHPRYWIRLAVNRDARSFEHSLSNERRVYTYANADLMVPDLQEKMPSGVRAEGSLPVYVTVDRSTLGAKLLTRLSALPVDLFIVCIVWLLRRMALSAVGTPESPADPFVWANVRRLRIVAALIVIVPVVQAYSGLAEWQLVSGTLNEFSMYTLDLSGMPAAFGIGLVLAVIAEVFAAGIRLREDVEGLV